mmetsp:Transcript_19858/g.28546  ORF Transcript_19858/g.28546 Transcript_19858/m.28546 type:complete len:326 (-) Transcript_19858:334-1311(-)
MLFAPVLTKKLEINKSIDSQIAEFSDLRASDPVRSKELFQIGEQLVTLATNGEFRKLRSIIDSSEAGDILPYFTSKMFLESLVGGHLMIASYIIDNGYPFNSPCVPCALHAALDRVDDERGVSIVEFLTAKNMDVNTQLPGSWLTALHIAVRRQLLSTADALLRAGADVNAVAKGDILPLNSAEDLASSEARDEMIALLKSNGARNTWRRNTDSVTTTTGVKKMETKFVTFSGGGATLAGGSTTPQSSGLVSMSGQHKAPVAQAVESAKPTYVKFRGGGPPPTMRCESSTLAISGSTGSTHSTSSKVDQKTYERSSDGGLMFSTS